MDKIDIQCHVPEQQINRQILRLHQCSNIHQIGLNLLYPIEIDRLEISHEVEDLENIHFFVGLILQFSFPVTVVISPNGRDSPRLFLDETVVAYQEA